MARKAQLIGATAFPGLVRGLTYGLAGATLLASAALNVRRYASIPAPPHWLGLIQAFRPATITFEIFLGLWLISGALPVAARRVAIACFSLFAGYTFYEALAGKADCGCFGQVHVNPWITFMLDSSLVLALTFPGKPANGNAHPRSWWKQQKWPVAAAAAIGLAVGVAAAVLHPKPVAANGLAKADGGQLVVLDPHQWKGLRLPVLHHIAKTGDGAPMGRQLSQGRWIVMFYHASCHECRATIPIYETLAQQESLSGEAPHVAFVRVPSGSGSSQAGLFHSNLALHGTLDSSENWFAQTPIVVQLRNGVVIRMATGSAAMNLGWLKR